MSDRNDDTTRDDDAFIARVAAPLRAPERVNATFGERVMAAVHAEVSEGRAVHRRASAPAPRGWWRHGWTLRLTPIAALAAVALIAALAAIGMSTVQRGPAALAAAARSDTVYVVRFVFVAPSAQKVAIVGDFNNWNRSTTALTPTGEAGLWTAAVTLPPGRHEYAFIVDGTRWTADPLAAVTIQDDFGTASSILTVGTRAS